VCAGVNWASQDHAVCIDGSDGAALDRFTVGHDAVGCEPWSVGC
jgi:hypothetical protein